jgi:phospholipid-binding lipoprotein MlaA
MKSILQSLPIFISLGFAASHFAHAQSEQKIDPWQEFNRAMFSFNDGIDRWAFKPLAKSYRFVMPDPVEVGISNIFNNMMEVPNTINGALQGDFKGAAHYTGRLLVNTTVGIGGLLDVAQYMNLPADTPEDFGQTLAIWGVGQGPYLVLPLLGPSTVRDGLGKPVDFYTSPTAYIDHVPTENTVRAVSLLDTRARLLELEKSITGDRYVFIRDVYLQRREFLINNGEVVDEFGTEEFDEDDFDAEF